jgi:crotonobetainyl-CoA:carnitine CoA-transferase CaiB-like acyl-CoA transferase
MLGRILAHLGAEVVKIESTAVMDVFRGDAAGGSPTQYPGGEPGARPYNRAVAFNTQNLGKRSINIDLKAPEARELARRLARSSDVVICNFSPRAMRGLGLDYESLRAVRGDIILLDLPAAGSGGPLSDIAGVGHTMEAIGGATSLQGYADGAPQRTGPAYLDPLGAFNGAIAVMLALYDRRRTGRGRRIELAQIEASMHWLGEWLLLCERTGEIPRRNGNSIAEAAPHGAYRARGDDEWIAIGVCSDDEWRALCEELGVPELADDSRFAGLEGRLAVADLLRATIESRTRARDKHELAAALQGRGVRAAPVCSGRDLHDDAQLREIGFHVEVEHPEAGRHRYQGLPFHFGAHALPEPAHAPLLGQHTRSVLRELGIEDDRIDALRDAGIIGNASVGS